MGQTICKNIVVTVFVAEEEIATRVFDQAELKHVKSASEQ